MSPELKLRLGDLIIRPVASFGCQIWGVNFLDLGKGVDGDELERIHLSYLRTFFIGLRLYLGIGTVYNLTTTLAHDVWKDNIMLFLLCLSLFVCRGRRYALQE